MSHPSARPLRLENRHTGEVLELRRMTRNGERHLELRGNLPPRREGPPLHIHRCEDEEGVVTAGTWPRWWAAGGSARAPASPSGSLAGWRIAGGIRGMSRSPSWAA